MPLLQTSANATARASGFARNALVRIYDLFNRVTSGSLGNTTSGSVWNAVSGAWFSNNGVAQSSTPPSSSPMATVVYAPNATLTLQNVSPGSGLVFWQSDAGDWWGAVATAAEVSVQTGTGYSYSSCCTGSNTCAYNSCCTGDPGGACIANSCCYRDVHTGQCVYSACCTTTPNTCTASSCCTGSNTCAGGYCIGYPTYTNYYNYILQILQSVAGTISVLASSILAQLTASGGVNGIQSLSVNTSGVSAVATGYSDPDMANALGSVAAAAGSAPTATGVGIMLVAVDSTASAIQGSTVGPFAAV